MNKFLAWMKGTGGIAAWVGLTIIVGCLGYMYASVIFPLNNVYSVAVHKADTYWKAVGLVLTAACIVGFILMNRSKSGASTGGIILCGVALALSFCAFAGFWAGL